MPCDWSSPVRSHLRTSCFSCVFECLVCFGDFRRVRHSDCLSWGRYLWLAPPLRLGPSADGVPHPRWPTHQNKRGSQLLVFMTNITHFLCFLRDVCVGRWGSQFISEDLPRPSLCYCLPLAHCPIHPTGAAKSKCQSRRNCCIPYKGQLVVATEGFVAYRKCLGFKKRLKSYNCQITSARLESFSITPLC